MFQHLFMDLMIHGEGGDGGAGAAPGAAPGAEASAEQTPVAGEMKPQGKPKARKYGRVDRLPYEYGKEPPASQASAETAQQQTQQPQKQPWEEVKKLYHDEYGKDVQTAIQGRFKNQADNEEALNAAKADLDKSNRLLAKLAESQYGIKAGADGKVDLAAIEQAASKRRAEEYAIENGVSEEYAEERLKMEDRLAEQDRQLKEFQEAERRRQQDAEQYAQFQRHRQQAEEFRQKMPGFDLLKEMEANPTFTKLIGFGVNVENAYYATHHEELMAVGQQAAAMQAQRALATSIQAGQSMPTEGGLGRSPAASPQRITDPRKWNKEMRKDIRNRVNHGEKIYL